MQKRIEEFAIAVKPSAKSSVYLADNRQSCSYDGLEADSFDLALTHPPYLNCFDYIPVFKLEYLWCENFTKHWSLQSQNTLADLEIDYHSIRKMETRSYPASDEALVDNYRAGNSTMLKHLHNLLRSGGYCCVVIGDATLKGKLLPVHTWFIQMGMDVGFTHERTIYRTTHYGTGKYAYADRSNYHGASEKRDAILVFKKR